MTEVDAMGLLCPLPVLRARKVLTGMEPGAVLRLFADDPAAIVDIPHFCAVAGHTLLSMNDFAQGQEYVIQRGSVGAGRS
jgi:tRNA 2-thiouridine synthesizing protein A